MNSIPPSLRHIRRYAVFLCALGVGVLLSGTGFAQPHFVHESSTELSVLGDFDGDGRMDIAIVDRASGHYRVGYQTLPNTFEWAPARAGGIAAPSGLAAGQFLVLGTDALAVTSPDANRVVVLDAGQSKPAVPQAVYPRGIGPAEVVGLDIGGIGNTPLDDLLVLTTLNTPNPAQAHTVRNAAGGFSPITTLIRDPAWTRPNPIPLGQTYPDLIVREGPNLFCGRLASGTLQPLLLLESLPARFDYAVAQLTGAGFTHVLAWSASESHWLDFIVDVATVGVGLKAAVDRIEPSISGKLPPSWVRVITASPRDFLLIGFARSGSVAVYEMNDAHQLVHLQTIAAPEDALSSFTGAAAWGNGQFMLFQGRDGISESFRPYKKDGSSWTAGTLRSLPPVKAGALGANVLEFDAEPMVDPAARLLRSLNAGEWSRSASLGVGPASLKVVSESFVDSAQGLDNPSSIDFGAPHPSTKFGLVNQLHESLCLFSPAPASGEEPFQVRISPDPGKYQTSVALDFTVDPAGAQVRYRLNQGAWLTFNPAAPPRLLTNTMVQYFAQNLGGTSKSKLNTVTFTFTVSPGALDSDLDGVPDFVELARNLDPEGGSDSDGDGFSDFEELLEGKQPDNAASVPDRHVGQQDAGLRLAVQPFPWDGGQETASLAQSGVAVRMHDLTGKLLGVGAVTNPPAAPVERAAPFTALPLNPVGALFVAATDSQFPIESSGTDPHLGRELVALLPAPERQPLTIEFAFGAAGGNLATEADAWITAARAAQTPPPMPVAPLDLAGTGTAALFERQMAEMLRLRGVKEWEQFTLFPFRPTDAGRFVPSPQQLAALETSMEGALSWRLRDILASTEALLTNPPNASVAAFNTLTLEIYRLNILSNNSAPGRYAPPFSVLREFIRTGQLAESYAADLPLDASLLAQASQGIAFAVASLAPRPVTSLTLRIRADSLSGPCTTLETTDLSAQAIHLFGADGAAFQFPEPFILLPGTLLAVTGFSDISSTTCAGPALQVIDASVIALPPPETQDANGNLLGDSWEKFFLGDLSHQPFEDSDGDQYSNLEEMLGGADPKNPGSKPGGPAAQLTPPALKMSLNPDGTLKLDWNFSSAWPASFTTAEFVLESAESLQAPFVEKSTQPVTAAGEFNAILPPSSSAQQFFRVRLRLRGNP